MSMSSEPRQILLGHRVLVTGAAGQLGRYVVPAARAQGAVVIAAGRRIVDGVDAAADLSVPAEAHLLVNEARPDIIIHAAACTDVDGIERDPARGERENSHATRNIADAARSQGAYLVAVSTDMVFPGDGGAPYVENALPSPISAYGASKLAAEEAVLNADVRFGVARTAWLYGGRGKHFPRTVMTVLRARGEIEVVDDEVGCPTFAGDLAEALVVLASRRGPGVFHLTNVGHASRFDFARETARQGGFDPAQVHPVSTHAFLEKYPLPARRPANSVLANHRAADLGIVLPEWQASLARYAPYLSRELTEVTS